MAVKGLLISLQTFAGAITNSSDRFKIASIFFLGLLGASCDLGIVLAVAATVKDYTANAATSAVNSYQMILMFSFLALRVGITVIRSNDDKRPCAKSFLLPLKYLPPCQQQM